MAIIPNGSVVAHHTPSMREHEIPCKQAEFFSIYSIAEELNGHELKNTRPFQVPHYNILFYALFGMPS